jgi:hypothetical protein
MWNHRLLVFIGWKAFVHFHIWTCQVKSKHLLRLHYKNNNELSIVDWTYYHVWTCHMWSVLVSFLFDTVYLSSCAKTEDHFLLWIFPLLDSSRLLITHKRSPFFIYLFYLGFEIHPFLCLQLIFISWRSTSSLCPLWSDGVSKEEVCSSFHFYVCLIIKIMMCLISIFWHMILQLYTLHSVLTDISLLKRSLNYWDGSTI